MGCATSGYCRGPKDNREVAKVESDLEYVLVDVRRSAPIEIQPELSIRPHPSKIVSAMRFCAVGCNPGQEMLRCPQAPSRSSKSQDLLSNIHPAEVIYADASADEVATQAQGNVIRTNFATIDWCDDFPNFGRVAGWSSATPFSRWKGVEKDDARAGNSFASVDQPQLDADPDCVTYTGVGVPSYVDEDENTDRTSIGNECLGKDAGGEDVHDEDGFDWSESLMEQVDANERECMLPRTARMDSRASSEAPEKRSKSPAAKTKPRQRQKHAFWRNKSGNRRTSAVYV